MMRLRGGILHFDPIRAGRLRDALLRAGLVELRGLDERMAPPAGLDLILVDYRAIADTLKSSLARLRATKVPVVVISDVPGEKTAVAAMRAGASHYLMESELYRVGEVIAEVMLNARHPAEHAGCAYHVAQLKQFIADRRFRDRVLAGIAEGILITDPRQPDHPVVFANQAFVRITGYPLDEILGRNPRFLQGPLTNRDSVAQMREAIRAGHPCRVELVNYRKDGTPFWNGLSVAPVRAADGSVEAFVATMTDVSAQKVTEEEQTRLTAILERTPDFVAVASMDGHPLYINRSGRQMVGLKEEAILLGLHMRDVQPPWAYARLFEQALPEALEQGHYSGETALRHLDGQEIPVLQVLMVHRGSDGTPAYYSTIMRSLVEHRLLEEQLRQAQKMEAIGQLAAGVAHDFNNLLTIISGYAELVLNLQRGGRSLPAGPGRTGDLIGGYMEQILKSGEHAASLTRQLLAFSRKQATTLVVVDPVSLVGNVEKMLRRLLGERIQLTVEFGPDIGQVYADFAQLEQVLLNLAVNARDAIAEKFGTASSTGEVAAKRPGKLTIELAEVSRRAPAPFQNDTNNSDSQVRLRIADNGAGMTEEIRSHIFEPFYTTKNMGTGLGLATVYGIVTQHGGWIEVASSPGEGTTFDLFFPRIEADVSKSVVPGRAFQRMEGVETVLVVEDDEYVRKVASESLRSHGYKVVEAECGDDALRMTENGPAPALVISDVVMPGLGGPALAGILRQRWPGIPVLFVSGYNEEIILEHGVGAEPSDFLHKPFTPLVLIRKVRSILDRRSPSPCPEDPR